MSNLLEQLICEELLEAAAGRCGWGGGNTALPGSDFGLGAD